jgi:hypothetical protein
VTKKLKSKANADSEKAIDEWLSREDAEKEAIGNRVNAYVKNISSLGTGQIGLNWTMQPIKI